MTQGLHVTERVGVADVVTLLNAGILGLVQFGAVLIPAAFSRAFPGGLLVAALAYLTLAPRYYWAD